MPITPLRARRFIIAFNAGAQTHKLFQVFFSRRDGSLHVNFPYYQHQYGMASVVEIEGAPNSVTVGDKGKYTSHRVKYSHHPDGRAHFSQDGRVRSNVRRQAVPLEEIAGHIFTVQLQGINEFDVLSSRRMSSGSKLVRFGDASEPPGLKFIGWWYPRNTLDTANPNRDSGPRTLFQKGTGQMVSGVALAPPTGWSNDDALCLVTCEAVPRVTHTQPSILTFMGGFDTMEVADDYSQILGFLCLIYPVDEEKYDEIVQRRGTIDFVAEGPS